MKNITIKYSPEEQKFVLRIENPNALFGLGTYDEHYLDGDDIQEIYSQAYKAIKGTWYAKGGGVRISNRDSRSYTSSRTPFQANNLSALWYDDAYVVLSYGYYPIYVWKDDNWYENSRKFSPSTAKQMGQSRPTGSTTLKSTDELFDIIGTKHFAKGGSTYAKGGQTEVAVDSDWFAGRPNEYVVVDLSTGRGIKGGFKTEQDAMNWATAKGYVLVTDIDFAKGGSTYAGGGEIKEYFHKNLELVKSDKPDSFGEDWYVIRDKKDKSHYVEGGYWYVVQNLKERGFTSNKEISDLMKNAKEVSGIKTYAGGGEIDQMKILEMLRSKDPKVRQRAVQMLKNKNKK